MGDKFSEPGAGENMDGERDLVYSASTEWMIALNGRTRRVGV